MKIQDITPNVPPIPRTFNLGLDATETSSLVEFLQTLFSGLPETVTSGTLTFCNIRLSQAFAAEKTSQVQVQFVPVSTAAAAASASVTAPSRPAASRTIPLPAAAAPAASSPAAPAVAPAAAAPVFPATK